MPNMFGGDHSHPSYDPRYAPKPDDPDHFIENNVEYRIDPLGTIHWETSDGRSGPPGILVNMSPRAIQRSEQIKNEIVRQAVDRMGRHR